MPTVHRTITTTAPPDAVWMALADFTTTETWDPPTVTTRRVSGDGGPGTVYENRSRIFGREVPIRYTVTESHRPELLRLRGQGSSFDADDTIEVHAREHGSVVDYTTDLRLHGFSRIATPLVGAFLRRTGDEAAGRMAAMFARLDEAGR